MDEVEVRLQAGNTSSVWRRGATIRRSTGPWTPAVHGLLRHLQARGFQGAPRVLGLDEQGREVLTYLEGEVPAYPTAPELWSEGVLEDLAGLLRRLHDATVGLDLPDGRWREGAAAREGGEVVCHDDVAHYDTVFRAGRPVALIDWDFAAPGPRAWDVAYAAYRFVPLSPDQRGSAGGGAAGGSPGRLRRFCPRSPAAARAGPGLSLAGAGPGRTLNVYLLGTVIVDSGVRWSHRRLARQLAGRRITAHMLTHAHFDHAGSSAWLCRTFDVPLWCGAGDAAAIGSGQVATHRSRLFNVFQRRLLPVTACQAGRVLQEGDVVEGFEVLEVPGHSPGALAFWRERDRVLLCGDVMANAGLRPERVRLVLPPAALSSDAEENRRSARRLAELRPRLACFGHGFAVTDPGRFSVAVERLRQIRHRR